MFHACDIRLQGFRNYPCSSTHFDTARVILTGDNGMGKTNLLEALSLLAPGRGLHGAPLGHMTLRGEKSWSLGFCFDTPEGELNMAMSSEGKGRRILRQDVPVSSQWSLQEDFHILWLTPAMHLIFQHMPQRRQTFHRFIQTLFPLYGPHLQKYTLLVKQRLRGLMSATMDPLWLESLEEHISLHAQELYIYQKKWCDLMNTTLTTSLCDAFPRPYYTLQVSEHFPWRDGLDTSWRKEYQSFLQKSRHRDAQSGRTCFGVHKIWIHVQHPLGFEAKEGSNGQQKALLLATLLGLAWLVSRQREKISLFLLDEVMAHLDAFHRETFLKEIFALPLSLWLTGTDASLFSKNYDNISLWNIDTSGIRRIT